MSDDDNDGQMIFGDLGGLKLPDICLTGEEKPRKKTSLRKLVPTGDRTRAHCAEGAHATACPTVVDDFYGDLFPTNFTFLRKRSWFNTSFVSDI